MSDAQPAAETSETPAAPPPTSGAAPDRAGDGPAHGGRSKLPHTVQTVKHGSVVADSPREAANVKTIRSSSEPVRSFTAHQREMLANLDKYDSLTRPADVKDEPAKPADDAAKPETTTGAAPTETPSKQATDTPAKPADPDLAARAERLAEHNKRLVAEVERLQSRGGSEPDERLQALDAIERGLTTDGLGSIRKLVALNIGAKDAAAPEVDSIMADLYAEWTAAELKVEMDPARRAKLESMRTRALVERDKRDREAGSKAEQARAAAEEQRQRDADVSRRLNARLDESKHAERFPLLMKHARTFDGASPGELLFSAIRAGIKAGEFPKDTPNDTLIAHYSKEIESHYKNLRDQLAEPSTSTAAPAPAPVPTTDKKADATETGVRTITNASASVAPPAPPAKPTPPAETERGSLKRKPGERESAFRERAAKFYFRDDD